MSALLVGGIVMGALLATLGLGIFIGKAIAHGGRTPQGGPR